MFNLRVLSIALLILLTAHVAVAEEKDFSGGLTGLSAVRPEVISSDKATDPNWRQKQEEVAAAAAAAAASIPPASAASIAAGQLGPGDKVRINVFGEEELSGEFEIDNTGSLALPLIGEVAATGLTPRELEKKLVTTLEKGYLVNPRVNIEVLNFRPFFILGEVNKPGSYPYVNDLNVINAVALAGGYTTRAKTGQVKLKRASSPDKTEITVGEDAKVYPGDVIRVDERFF